MFKIMTTLETTSNKQDVMGGGCGSGIVIGNGVSFHYRNDFPANMATGDRMQISEQPVSTKGSKKINHTVTTKVEVGIRMNDGMSICISWLDRPLQLQYNADPHTVLDTISNLQGDWGGKTQAPTAGLNLKMHGGPGNLNDGPNDRMLTSPGLFLI
jgi:hypothetical protein